MKSLSVNHVPDFAKQKQDLALRFRDSARSRGEIPEELYGNAEENQQNYEFSEDPTVCFLRGGVGRTAAFAIPFVLMRSAEMARPAGLEPAAPRLEGTQYKTLSAAAGVAYEEARQLSHP
jgi:hypothetical protein